jgi:hypothetical protein
MVVAVSMLALPTVGGTQGQRSSNASLQDTLNWLRDFLPSATGARYDDGSGANTTTTRLIGSNTCSITMATETVQGYTNNTPESHGTMRVELSLADIDSKSITVTNRQGIVVDLNSPTKSIRVTRSMGGYKNQSMQSLFWLGNFNDRSGAERAANALRHAVDLCAKPQIF